MLRILPFICLVFALQIAFGQAIQANLLDTWNDSTIQGTAFYDNAYNEVWGISINGYEYAIIGSTEGTHFIDVSDATNISEACFIAGKDRGTHIIHRDYHDHNGFLYAVCDEGASSLQIMDLRQLPDTVIVVYDDDTYIYRSHNIFIDSLNSRLYSFGTRGRGVGYSGMSILDISDPYNPQYLNGYRDFGGLDADYVHDGYVRNHTAFLNCGDGMAIINYEDVNQPKEIALLPSNAYLQSGYNHSGWPTNDCSHYLFADETWGTSLKSLDLEDAPDIEVVDYFNDESGIPSSIPHNLVVACDYLYVSYYHQGLQVYDISVPASPERVLYYDTSTEPDGNTYKGAWGVYPFLPSGNILVSDMQRGLFVFEGIDNSCKPYENLSECFQTVGLGVSTQLNPTLSVFPNPVSNTLNLEIKGSKPTAEWKAKLIDVQGNEQMQLNLGLITNERIEIPIPRNIKDGFYVLKMQNSKFEFYKKVFICR